MSDSNASISARLVHVNNGGVVDRAVNLGIFQIKMLITLVGKKMVRMIHGLKG